MVRCVVVLSGRTDESLRAQAARLRSHLDAEPALSLLDVAYSLATTRTHFERRASLLVRRIGRAAGAAVVAGGRADAAGVALTPASGLTSGKLAFLFTGQGSQRAGMGRGLYDGHPVFRAALEECAEYLDGELERPLLEVMFAGRGAKRARSWIRPATPSRRCLRWSGRSTGCGRAGGCGRTW